MPWRIPASCQSISYTRGSQRISEDERCQPEHHSKAHLHHSHIQRHFYITRIFKGTLTGTFRPHTGPTDIHSKAQNYLFSIYILYIHTFIFHFVLFMHCEFVSHRHRCPHLHLQYKICNGVVRHYHPFFYDCTSQQCNIYRFPGLPGTSVDHLSQVLNHHYLSPYFVLLRS